MIDNLPKPIALYIAAENSADATLFDQAFAEDAIVRDENETHQGLAEIKKWKAETKRKYQHTVDPLSVVEKEGEDDRHKSAHGKFPRQSDRARVRVYNRGR